MGIEIRACKDRDEVAAYGRIVQYVFAGNFEEVQDEINATSPDWTTCAFDGDRMVATMGVFPFTVRLNGAPVRMGGVTAVGTLPEYRRQGLLRRIMTQGFETMREREQSIAILYASMGAIYQRFGYGMASAGVDFSFDPRYVAFESGPQPSGRVTLMTKDDAYPIIKQLYIQYASPRNLAIHRAAALWNASTLRPPKKGEPVHVGVYHDHTGEARGHIVYATRDAPHQRPGPSQEMDVSDFIYLDMDAFRGLWEYIRRHDLVGQVNMHNIGEDNPAPDLLLEPRMLNRKTGDAIWMRIVDVEKALPQRPYGARGELTFEITGDTMCPWNEGTWMMETDGTTTSVRRTDRPADLFLSLNTLAGLMAGFRSATHYSRAGRLSASGDGVLARADAMFKTTYAPHCLNGF